MAQAKAAGERAAADTAELRREVQQLFDRRVATPEQARELTSAVRRLGIRLRMRGEPDATVQAELDNLGKRALAALSRDTGLTLEPQIAVIDGRRTMLGLDVRSDGPLSAEHQEMAGLGRRLVYDLNRLAHCPQKLDDQTVYLFGLRDALLRRALHLPDRDVPSLPQSFDPLDQKAIQELLGTIHELADSAPDLPSNLLADLGDITRAAVDAPEGGVGDRILDALRTPEVGTPVADATRALRDILDRRLAPDGIEVPDSPIGDIPLSLPNLSEQVGEAIQGYAEAMDGVRGGLPPTLPFEYFTPAPIEWVNPDDGSVFRLAAGTGIGQTPGGDYRLSAPGLELGTTEWNFLVKDGVIQLGDSLDLLALGGMQITHPDAFAELTGVTAQIDRKNNTALVAAEGAVIDLASGQLELEQATLVYGPTGDVAAAVRSVTFGFDGVEGHAENITLYQTIVDGATLTSASGEHIDVTADTFTLQAGTLSGTMQDGDWLLNGTDVTFGWGDNEARGNATLHLFDRDGGGSGLELHSDNLAIDWGGYLVTSTGEGGKVTLLQTDDGTIEQLEVISPDFTFGDGDPSHAVHATGAAVNLLATDTGHLLTGSADTFSYGEGTLNLTGVHDLEVELTGDVLTHAAGEVESLEALDGKLSANGAAVDLRFNEDGTLARAAAAVGSLDWNDGTNVVALRDGASMSIDQSSPGKILVDAAVGHASGSLDGTGFDVLSGSGSLSIDEATGTLQLTAGAAALVVDGEFGRIEVAEGATVNLLAVDNERIELEAVVGKAHLLVDDGTAVDLEQGMLNIQIDEVNGVTAAQLEIGNATLSSTELGVLVMADQVTVDLRAEEGKGVRLDARAGSLSLERDGHKVLLTEASALLEVDEVAGTTRLVAEVGTASWQSPDGTQLSAEGLKLTLNEEDGRLTTIDASLAKGALSGKFGESQLDGGVDGVTIHGAFSEDGTRLAELQASAGHIDLTSTDAFGRTSTLSFDNTQLSLASGENGVDVLHFESSAAGQVVLDGRTLGIDTEGKPFTFDATVDNGRLTSVAAHLPGRYTLAGEGQEFWLENAHGALTEKDGRTHLTAGFDRGGVVLDGLVGNANGVSINASTSETDAHLELTVGELFLKDTSLAQKYFGGEVEIIGVRAIADVTENAAHGRVEIQEFTGKTADTRVLLRNPEGRVFALDVAMNQEDGGSRVTAGWELAEGGIIQLLGDDTEVTVGGHTGQLEIVRAPGASFSEVRLDTQGLDLAARFGDTTIAVDSEQASARLIPEGILLENVANTKVDLQVSGFDIQADIAAINNQLVEWGSSESTVNGRPMQVTGLILHPPDGEGGQITASVVVEYEGVKLTADFEDLSELRAMFMAGDNMLRATVGDPSGHGNTRVAFGDLLEAEGAQVDALLRYKQFNAHEFMSELGLLLKNDGVEYLPGLRIDDANKLMHLGVRGSDDSKFGAHAMMTVRFSHDPNDPPIYALTNTHPTGHTEMSAVIKAGLHGNTGKRRHRASFYVGAGQAAALDFMVLEGNMKLLGRDLNSASLPANFFFGVGYSTESAKSAQAINIGGFHNTVGELLEESQADIFHERVTGGGYLTAEHTDKERQQTFRLGVVSGVDNEGEHAGTWVNVGFTKRFAGPRRQRLTVDTQSQDVSQIDWLRGELPGAEPAETVTPARTAGESAPVQLDEGSLALARRFVEDFGTITEEGAEATGRNLVNTIATLEAAANTPTLPAADRALAERDVEAVRGKASVELARLIDGGNRDRAVAFLSGMAATGDTGVREAGAVAGKTLMAVGPEDGDAEDFAHALANEKQSFWKTFLEVLVEIFTLGFAKTDWGDGDARGKATTNLASDPRFAHAFAEQTNDAGTTAANVLAAALDDDDHSLATFRASLDNPVRARSTSQAAGSWGEVRAREAIRAWQLGGAERTCRRALEAVVAEVLGREPGDQAIFFAELHRAGLFEEGIRAAKDDRTRRDLLGRLMVHGDHQLVAAAAERSCAGSPATDGRMRDSVLALLGREPIQAERAAVISATFLAELRRRPDGDRSHVDRNVERQRGQATALLQRALRSGEGRAALRAAMRVGATEEAVGVLENLRQNDRDAAFASLAAADARGLITDQTDGQVFRLLGARMIDKDRAGAFGRVLDGIPADAVPVMLATLEPKACEELIERLDDDKSWRGLRERMPPEVRAEVVALLHNPRLRAAHLATLATEDATAGTRFRIGQALRAIKITHGVWVHVPPHLSDRLRDPEHARAILDAVVEVEKQIRAAKESGRDLDADVDLVLNPVGFTDHAPAYWDLDADRIVQRRPLIAAQLAAVNLRLQGELPVDLLSESPELRRGLINFIDFIAAQPETLRQHGVAGVRIAGDVGGFLRSEARVKAYELGEDAAGNEQVVGVLEVDDSVLRGFAAPVGSKERNEAVERINEPIREEEDAKLLSLNLTAPVAGDDEVRGAVRVSPFGEKGPSITAGSDVTGNEHVGLGYHRSFEVGETDVDAFAGLVHADDELALSVGVKARRLIWQTDNDYIGTFGSLGVAVGGSDVGIGPFARVGLHGQLAGKAGMMQFEVAVDPLSLRPVFWDVEYQTKFSDDQKVWALVKFNTVIGPAAGIGVKGMEVAVGPLGVEIGPDGGRKLILTIVPPFIYLHGQSVELSRRYLGPFPDIGSLKPRGMSHLPPEVIDALFEDHMAADGIVAGNHEIRKTIEDYHLGHQMVALFAAIEEGQPGAERALQSWLNEVRVATLIDGYLTFHKQRPRLGDDALAKAYAASTGGRSWIQASESERQQFRFYVRKSENWKVFSEKFAETLDNNEAAVIPALERYRAAVVSQSAEAREVRGKIGPVDPKGRLDVLGVIGESRVAIMAARTRMQDFDAELGRALALAGEDRAIVQKMRAEVRENVNELNNCLTRLGDLISLAHRERDSKRLTSLEKERQNILGDVSRLLAGSEERPTGGLLLGGAQWEEKLFELQQSGRPDVVEVLNTALWQLKRDATLWALVRPAAD